MHSSVISCSTACLQKNQDLQERITALELQVNQIAGQLSGFDEIKRKILLEVREYPMIGDTEENINNQEIMENAVSETDEDFSKDDGNKEQKTQDFMLGNDIVDNGIWENSDSNSRASTPDLVIDEDCDGYCSPETNTEIVPSSTVLDSGAGTDGQGGNETGSMEWINLDPEQHCSNATVTVKGTELDDRLGKPTQPKINTQTMISNQSRAGHAEKLLRDNALVCPQCSNVFKHRGGLNQHIRSVHKGIRYMCGAVECSSCFTRLGSLREHQRKNGHQNGSIQIRIV